MSDIALVFHTCVCSGDGATLAVMPAEQPDAVTSHSACEQGRRREGALAHPDALLALEHAAVFGSGLEPGSDAVGASEPS